MDFVLTPESLAMLAAVVLSLAFSYIPGLSDWYGALSATHKRLIMAGLLLIVAGGAFGLSCAGIINGVDCDRAGLIDVIWAFILAVIANQSTYALSPRKG